MIIKINRKRRLATQREPGSIFTDCEQSLFCLKINERPQYDVDVQAPVYSSGLSTAPSVRRSNPMVLQISLQLLRQIQISFHPKVSL